MMRVHKLGMCVEAKAGDTVEKIAKRHDVNKDLFLYLINHQLVSTVSDQDQAHLSEMDLADLFDANEDGVRYKLSSKIKKVRQHLLFRWMNCC